MPAPWLPSSSFSLSSFPSPGEGGFGVPWLALGWVGERGPELISHLGSSWGSCWAVKLGMCPRALCQGPNLGDRALLSG